MYNFDSESTDIVVCYLALALSRSESSSETQVSREGGGCGYPHCRLLFTVSTILKSDHFILGRMLHFAIKCMHACRCRRRRCRRFGCQCARCSFVCVCVLHIFGVSLLLQHV